MNPRGKRAPVVVGVAAADDSGDAVDWAAAEAAARGSWLRVVHTFTPPPPAPYPVIPPFDGFLAAREAAESVLHRAALRARTIASDIEMTAQLQRGPAAHVLRDETDNAELLVLGSHGQRGLRGLLTGSVAAEVAAHAHCPTVVIPPSRGGGEHRGTAVPRVVVGIDAASCAGAVGFAFDAAHQRGIGLTAVHACNPDPPGTGEQHADRILEPRLRRWQAEFPDVQVTTTLVRDDPVRALIAESAGAAMLVLGSRGRGHLLGTLLGSVSRPVLKHASAPVAIVRPTCTHHPWPLLHGRQGADSVLEPERPTDSGTSRRNNASKSRRGPR